MKGITINHAPEGAVITYLKDGSLGWKTKEGKIMKEVMRVKILDSSMLNNKFDEKVNEFLETCDPVSVQFQVDADGDEKVLIVYRDLIETEESEKKPEEEAK